MGNQEIPSNVRIRYDDEELGAHPDREEGSVFLGPVVHRQLRILAQVGIANGRSWGKAFPASSRIHLRRSMGETK